MQMIDVLKRLAELDSTNPNIEKTVVAESLDECGIMPEMGMGMPPERPTTPATINMTAGSASELGDLLKDIVSLAGMKQDSVSAALPVDTHEPVTALAPVGPVEPVDSMRAMLDKMNTDDDEISGLDQDNDGDHDMKDHDMEKDDEENKEESAEYDNTPADPNDKNEFDANQFAKNDNQPGQGDRMDGDRPKAFPTMEQIEQSLFTEYQRFVSE